MNISFDEAKREIEKFHIKAVWPHLLDRGVTTPQRLHHYTNGIGLHGILTSRSIWASDVHFLNDRSELVYGHRLVRECLLRQSGPLVAELVQGQPSTEKEAQIYAISFCEHGDLLSQWRGYARVRDGYSMAFSFSGLLNSCKDVFLTKVLYQPKDQEVTVLDLVRSLADLFARIDLPQNQTALLKQSAVEAVWALPFRLKDSSFEGEQEWRLVAGLASGYQERFRVVDGSFVPYVEVPFDGEILEEIRQGPGAYRSANVEALRRLLVAEKFDNTNVEKSPVPL